MDEKFLIDTNIIIYYLDNKIPESQDERVSIIFENSFILSTISKIEVLGWHRITEKEKRKIEHFLSNANVIYIDRAIEQKAIELKQKNKMATPDSIIGATAILNNLTLVTRNKDDFNKIRGLKIYNPFEHHRPQ